MHQDYRISKDMVRERERGHHKFSVEAAEEMDTIFPMFFFFKMSGILVAHKFNS